MAVASRAPLSAINTAAGPSTRRTNPSNSRRPRANEPIASSSNMSSSKTNSPPPEDDYVIALHDFSPAPPNAQCLSFLAGQVIHVLNRDATGWWDGELEGKRGWFPSNYVKSDIGNLGDDLANGILRNASQKSRSKSMSHSGESEHASSHSHSHSQSSTYSSSYDLSEASCPPIMVPIVHALSLLQNAVTARRITHFQPSTACVISCVRSVLSATDCLGRDSPFLANFPALASARKHVLSELAKLVTQARKVSEGKMTIMEANRLDDEMAAMLNMGDAVFGKVRKFLAVAVECGVELPERRSMSPSPVSVEDDAYSYDRAVADVTPTLTSSYSPPDVYSDRRLSSQQQPKSGARTKSLGDLKGGGGSARPSLDQSEPYAEDSDAAGDSSLGHTPARPKHRRRHKAPAFPPSSNGDSTEYAYAEPIAHQRGTKLSISSNDSFSSSHGSSDFAASSPGFPSGPTSTPQVLITLRATQDRLLSIIAAFIGHVHSYSNYSHASSKGHLIELTKETVDQVRHLLALVDSVISTPEILEVKSRELIVLEAAKATLFSQTSSLVDSIRSITSHPSLENEDQEKGTCLQAATGAIRAGAECVTAVQRCLSRRIGEEPFTVTVVPPPSPDSIPQGYSGPTTPPSQSTHGLRKNTLSYLGRKTATLRSGQSPGDDTPDVDEETELDIATQDETVRVRPQMDDQDEYRIHGGPRLGPLASSREASSRGSESTNGSNLSLLRSDTGTLASSMEDPKIGSAIALGRSFMEGTRTSGEEESASEHSLGRSSEEKSPENLSSLKKKIIYGTLPSVPSPTEFKSDDPYAWLLTHDYDEKDIHFNAQGVMTGATLPVMVEKMTSHFYTPEPTFLSTFFLTFRLFTTPKEFVEAIIARYDVPPPPPTMPPDEVVMWQDKKVKVVRVRILNLLKTWIDSNWRSADSEAIPLLQEFITEKLASNTMFASPSRRLLDTLNKRQAQEQPLTPRSIDRIKSVDGLRSREGNYSSNTYSGGAPAGTPPTPVINKTLFSNLRSPSFANVSILDFDVLELARQLTIMESRLYCGISSDDMLDSARPGVRATESVKAATALSNAISGWVIESILNERDLKKRITLVKFFIKLADRCLNLNNFSTMFSILGALESSPIMRLSKTWTGLQPKAKTMIDSLRKVMKRDKNFYNYRQLLRTTPPPAVPFIGTFLTDLLMNGENAAYRPSPADPRRTLVNFWKFAKISDIIQEVLRFQVPHNLMEIPEVQKYLTTTFDNVKAIGDLTEIHNRSLQIEPRAPDDRHGAVDSKSGKLDFAWSLRGAQPTTVPHPITA